MVGSGVIAPVSVLLAAAGIASGVQRMQCTNSQGKCLRVGVTLQCFDLMVSFISIKISLHTPLLLSYAISMVFCMLSIKEPIQRGKGYLPLPGLFSGGN